MYVHTPWLRYIFSTSRFVRKGTSFIPQSCFLLFFFFNTKVCISVCSNKQILCWSGSNTYSEHNKTSFFSLWPKKNLRINFLAELVISEILGWAVQHLNSPLFNFNFTLLYLAPFFILSQWKLVCCGVFSLVLCRKNQVHLKIHHAHI